MKVRLGGDEGSFYLLPKMFFLTPVAATADLASKGWWDRRERDDASAAI